VGALCIGEPFIRQMLAHLPNTAVHVFDTDLLCTLAGGSLLHDLGMEPGAIEGTPVLREFDTIGHSRAHDACQAALRGSTISFELTTKRGRFLECTAVPVFNEGLIVGGLMISRDVSDRKRNESQLQAFTRMDPLTGVANRLRFQLALRRALQDGVSLALLALDIDDFTRINTLYGHQAGDKCLRSMAQALEECTRPGDTVARVGGDQFELLLRDSSLDAAVSVARRIRDAVVTLPYTLTVSIGIACFPHDATDSHALRLKAGEAMHADKKAHAMRDQRDAHS
jgi:diguanylate cyclase (GGDEF)-like protein